MNAETVMPRDPQVQALTAALAAPFEPRDVKYKPQMVKNNRCLAMAYIDARLIQDRLDEVLGVENWEDAYKILPDGSVMCRLRCKLGDRWITKTDVGSPSEQPDVGDRLKAAFSDALKRAAVKFGIGRYLYRLPAQWVDYDPVKKQIAQVPQMPAFGIPKSKTPPAPKPAPPAATQPKQEAPKPESPKVEAPKAEAPKPPCEAEGQSQSNLRKSAKPEGGSEDHGASVEWARTAPAAARVRREARGAETLRGWATSGARYASRGEGGLYREHDRMDRPGNPVRGRSREGIRAVGAAVQVGTSQCCITYADN